MPLVHWLPKTACANGRSRLWAACGVEPKWGWLNGASVGEKAQAYSAFVINETFYRSFREVRGSFNEVGFTVTPIVADHPSLRRLAALPLTLRKLVVDFPVMLFQTVEILVRKPA